MAPERIYDRAMTRAAIRTASKGRSKAARSNAQTTHLTSFDVMKFNDATQRPQVLAEMAAVRDHMAEGNWQRG